MNEEIETAFRNVQDVDFSKKEFRNFAQDCEQLCKQYDVTPQQLASHWEVTALNYTNRKGMQLFPKVREFLSREARKHQSRNGPGEDTVSPTISRTKSIKRISAQKGAMVVNEMGNSTPPMKRKGAGDLQGSFKKPNIISQSDLAGPASPGMTATISSSPIVNKAGYANRKNRGKVEVRFNDKLDVDGTINTNVKRRIHLVNKIKPYRYMYSTLDQRADEMEAQLLEMKEYFKERHFWTEDDFSPVGTVSQTPILVFGRICCEAISGKINAESLLLEGSLSESNGARVKLEVNFKNGPPTYSIFPGQIVAVKGISSGHTIHASQIFSSARAEHASTARSVLVKDAAAQEHELKTAPMSMIVASGPFTTNDDLEYEPLEDLLGIVANSPSPPDALVLLGPFVDCEHPEISMGRCRRKFINASGKEEFMNLTFHDLLSVILTRVATAVDGLKTRVILVPSTNDVTHHNCFPQPPMVASVLNDLELSDPSQFILAPNPGTFSINEVVISCSTRDTIFDLVKDNASKFDAAQNRQRIPTIAQHILDQRSFYPLYPPTVEAKLEFTKRSAFSISTQPDIMILPSKLQFFVNDVAGSVCINPGKLARGKNGGTYAQITIKPRTKEELLADQKPDDTQDPLVPNKVSDRCKVNVVRI